MSGSFYIAQAIGALTTLVVIVSAQLKDMKYILFCQICANLMVAASSALLGGLSGAWICVVAALQTIFFYLMDKRGISEKTRNRLLLLFAAMYVCGTVLVYQGWGDLVSCACAFLYLLAIVQKKSSKYRIFICLNAVLWVVYDLTILAFGNLLTHGIEVLSVIVGILRLDIPKKESGPWEQP